MTTLGAWPLKLSIVECSGSCGYGVYCTNVHALKLAIRIYLLNDHFRDMTIQASASVSVYSVLDTTETSMLWILAILKELFGGP